VLDPAVSVRSAHKVTLAVLIQDEKVEADPAVRAA
jgi:hypothetical protein